MARIMILCPNQTPLITARYPVFTGMTMDRDSFENNPLGENQFCCPQCKRHHIWLKEDAFLEEDGRHG